jgi:hypothetical protein
MSRRCTVRQIENSSAIGRRRSSVWLSPDVELTFPCWASFSESDERTGPLLI